VTPADVILLTDEEIAHLAVHDPDRLAEYYRYLSELSAQWGLSDWRAMAHPEQLPPDGAWSTLFLRGGRGSGKTFAGARIFAELIRDDPARVTEGPGSWAIVAPSFGEARDKCVEGEAGLLTALGTSRADIEARRSPTVRTWNRSIGELILVDGTRVLIDGADDGATSVQGENLRGAWCDEIGLWKQWETAWDESLGFALRKGEARRIATGTPKNDRPARQLVLRLLRDRDVVTRRLRTADNLANLAPAFAASITRWEGTRLGRQELEGELLEDVEGALWKSAWIEERRADVEPGFWQQKRVAMDPSDGTQTGAEQGLAVVGLGSDWDIYVVASEGLRGSSLDHCKRAIALAVEHGATIVVERNHGGGALVELLEIAMREMGKRVAVKTVWASDGKRTRAEPVAALYETGKVRHLGIFPELEEQMTNFTGAANEKSPDRLDAAVWGIADLMGSNYHGPLDTSGGAVPYTTSPLPGGDGAVPYHDAIWASPGDPAAWVPAGFDPTTR
jgi:phage terminase large subunit-like protein